MNIENFSVAKFGLKDEQYTMAFAHLIGMLKGQIEFGKETFTKEEIVKFVLESVNYAKE